MKINKMIMVLPFLLLTGCSVAQPEAKTEQEEEPQIEKPNDEIIIGITDKGLEQTFYYEEDMREFIDSEEFSNSYNNYFAWSIHSGGWGISTYHGFDSVTFYEGYKIAEVGEDGVFSMNAKLTYPTFSNSLQDDYNFCALVANITTKEIYSTYFFRILDLEQGDPSSLEYTLKTTYASFSNNKIDNKHFKYSRARIELNPDNVEVKDYKIKEYNSDNVITKTVQCDFEDYFEYVASKDSSYIIIEKNCNEYTYNWDTDSLDKKEVQYRELINFSEYEQSTSFFYKDNSGKAQKEKINIFFGEPETIDSL